MLRISRILIAPILSFTLSASILAQTGTDPHQQNEARSFVASVAKLIYTTAWPTATYSGFNIDSIHPGPNGTLDITTRFDGLSHWDDSDLWLLLTIRMNREGIQDVFVRNHNALLVPPFATARALGQLTLTLAQQYQARPSNSIASTPPAPSTETLPLHETQKPLSQPERAGAVCISNLSPYTVHFVYRWGDAEWQPIDLAASQTEAIWWTYSGNSSVSPPLTVFYSEQNASASSQHTYALQRSQAQLPITCNDVTDYEFSIDKGVLTLFLVPDKLNTSSAVAR